MFTPLRRTAGVLLVSAAVALIFSPSAAAHVDATLDGTGPGGFGVVTLGVPTEAGKPPTTKVEVRIPEETPLRAGRWTSRSARSTRRCARTTEPRSTRWSAQ